MLHHHSEHSRVLPPAREVLRHRCCDGASDGRTQVLPTAASSEFVFLHPAADSSSGAEACGLMDHVTCTSSPVRPDSSTLSAALLQHHLLLLQLHSAVAETWTNTRRRRERLLKTSEATGFVSGRPRAETGSRA